MTFTSTADSSSIFKDGKLKPGIYKIQNLYSETFLDYEAHSKEMFSRPANELGEGRGLVSLSLSLIGSSCLKVRSGRSNPLGLDSQYSG